MRDELTFLTTLAIATTLEEEDEPLQVPRSHLGECFGKFAEQLNEILESVEGCPRD